MKVLLDFHAHTLPGTDGPDLVTGSCLYKEPYLKPPTPKSWGSLYPDPNFAAWTCLSHGPNTTVSPSQTFGIHSDPYEPGHDADPREALAVQWPVW